MRPAYRSGSSSEALSAARRTQLNRGLGLVLGVFAVYALASCFLPGLLPLKVYGGYRVGELVAAAQVLVIAAGVLCHDRHARRHVEPLAQRVVNRERAEQAEEARRGSWNPNFNPNFSPDSSPNFLTGSGSSTRTARGTIRATGRDRDPVSSDSPGDDASFNAFDSSRAFGGGHTQGAVRRTSRATT